jgi:hypothetical protein
MRRADAGQWLSRGHEWWKAMLILETKPRHQAAHFAMLDCCRMMWLVT